MIMAGTNVVMWNCSGLLPSSFALEKIELIQLLAPFDVLALIETHHKNFDMVSPSLHIFTNTHSFFHTEASEDDPFAGIIVLVAKDLAPASSSVLIPGRLLNLELARGTERFNVSVLYGYTGSNATLTRMNQITGHLTTLHMSSDNNIIMGDFNFVDCDLDRTNNSRTGMNRTDKALSSAWNVFANQCDLSDPFRLRNPKRKMFSYIHTQNGAKSRIDRVYASDEECAKFTRYKHTPVRWPKAHRIISFSIIEDTERGPGFWKLNTSVLPDRAYYLIVESTINDVLALHIPDAIERWLVFIETIRLESQIYCSRKRFFEKEIKRMCEKNIELLECNPSFTQNAELQMQHDFFTNKLNDWTRKQIEGHQIRVKTQPKFEYCEPDIDFYASLEKKSAKKRTITHLKNGDGNIFTDTDGMQRIASEYYTELFSTKSSDPQIAAKLLGNIHTTVPPDDRSQLNRLISREELEKAVMKLKRNKSPGPDGLPAEFYQQFWNLLSDLYFDYICAVQNDGFPDGKNCSVTTLIFKNKGDIGLLAYYRPIALMNVDVKILTKLLSMRLVTVLPKIIHESQTSVYGRTIGDNINLVRDIIDLANKNDMEAALLFLDQEKAFDRVSHDFLFKVLDKFGIGSYFSNWVKTLYSNSSTRINVNGFLTNRVALRCGVRQGCPLSALLYVMIIEILALQLRANPNIVGFCIQGEKLISSHYADDTVIKITQNRCFKEVYKDLRDYEKATGAKVNYEKTNGLWLGKWKNRRDDPFAGLYDADNIRIKWVNSNIKHLGVYVGNNNPAIQTFAEIIPKVQRRLNFWKPLRLPVLAKARVIEIFHASKLFFAANFYPIPKDMLKNVSLAFAEYINFPSKRNSVSKMEMEKLRDFGGLKLINIKLKAETPKIKWLMRLISDDKLLVQRFIFDELMRLEGLYLSGCELIFSETNYIRKCKISNGFYNEALLGISKLNTYKHFVDINEEHLFHNKIFTASADDDDVHDRTLAPFRGNRVLSAIRSYGDLLQAEISVTDPKLLAVIHRKKHSIDHVRDSVESHLVVGLSDGKEHRFESIPQMVIYSELIHEQSRDHGYVGRWHVGRFGYIAWDEIWPSVHSQFFTEKSKSAIWEQLHLNFLTTHNINTWYNQLNPCPLCHKIPDDIFHIIVDCRFTKVCWKRLENVLLKIVPQPVTLHEMAFGLQSSKNTFYQVTLRNWITFNLRLMIMLEERKAHKTNEGSVSWVAPSHENFFAKFNYEAKQELKDKKLLYDSQNLSGKFEKIATVNNAVSTLDGDKFTWKDIM